MEQYKSNEDEFYQDSRIAINIFKITQNIAQIYYLLYNAQVINQENDIKYYQTVNYLSIISTLENYMYQEINPQTIRKLINYLQANKIIPNEFPETTSNLVLGNITNQISRRIYNSFAEIENNNIITSHHNSTLLQDQIQLNLNNKVHQAIEKDHLLIALYFLETYLNNENYLIIKNELIKAKYCLIFINRFIQFQAINHNFTFNELNISSKLTADYAKLSLPEYTKRKDIILSNIFNREYANLILTQDDEYNNPTNIAISLLRQCFIKSAIILMSDNQRNEYNNQIKETFKSKEYQLYYPNNSISENIILTSFEEYPQNKNKIRLYSFIPPKKL